MSQARNSRVLPFIPTVTLLLIAGCAVGPDFKKSAAPDVSDYTVSPLSTTVAVANLPGGDAQRFAEGIDISADWWTLFHSRPLDELIERSLASNADLKAAQAALTVARENVMAQRGVYYPSVDANFQFSVEGRDLAGAVGDAMQQVNRKVALPQGYRLDWGGEYTEYTASRQQLSVILPLTLFLIFLLLFALYNNFKFPFITVLGVLLSAPVGGIVALWITGTPFSVSSGIGFLALFGVSVQTAIVYISYVNELRRGGTALAEAIRQGAILRLRPIMMTALVAALGLLPVALATGVGTDSQRPFALVIVSGLFTRLLISIFLMPLLYTLVAGSEDRLEV